MLCYHASALSGIQQIDFILESAPTVASSSQFLILNRIVGWLWSWLDKETQKNDERVENVVYFSMAKQWLIHQNALTWDPLCPTQVSYDNKFPNLLSKHTKNSIFTVSPLFDCLHGQKTKVSTLRDIPIN